MYNDIGMKNPKERRFKMQERGPIKWAACAVICAKELKKCKSRINWAQAGMIAYSAAKGYK